MSEMVYRLPRSIWIHGYGSLMEWYAPLYDAEDEPTQEHLLPYEPGLKVLNRVMKEPSPVQPL